MTSRQHKNKQKNNETDIGNPLRCKKNETSLYKEFSNDNNKYLSDKLSPQ